MKRLPVFACILKSSQPGLTARQLAARISPDLPVHTVHRWMRGRNQPPLWCQNLILEKLQCPSTSR